MTFGPATQEISQARSLPWYGWAALCTLIAGEFALFLGVYAVQVLFYCIAWWSYIMLVDAWVWKRRGHSLLRNRRWEFFVLAFWSVAIWNLFEVFNFRLKNWFYVNVPTQLLFGAIFTFFAYATVVPGLFETYDLLCAYGVAERVRVRPWRIRPAGLALSVSAGLAMLISPLLWPRYAFPWVWGFVVFLGDPLGYRTERTRAESLLGHFERGDPRPFLRLLLAGLICGGLWEFWNFWAYTKWIYTVPFFEDLKWFEMPLMGFLGFPPFALECHVLMNLLNHFRRGRGWEDSGQRGPGAPIGLAVTAVVLACLLDVAAYIGIDRLTIQSYSPTLTAMDGVSPGTVDRLAGVGIVSPPALLNQVGTPERVAALSKKTGIPVDELLRLGAAARLVDLKGLGATHYNELRRLDIGRVEDLARQDPATLAARWQGVADKTAPTPAQVKVWVRAARQNDP
jgi:hypothetical protein